MRPASPPVRSLQELCELGQSQLTRTDYLGAEATLLRAERLALDSHDFDTLSRLYMPLQESRRQRRQRCAEGIVRLDIVARGANESIDVDSIVSSIGNGQLLIAGWGSIRPALDARRIAENRSLFVEVFLAASYPVGGEIAIAIVPLESASMPAMRPRQTIDELIRELPAHSIVMNATQLPRGSQQGTPQTFAQTMAMWESLHAPFLAQADSTPDGVAKIEAYRRAIAVDYACELAHQNLSASARRLIGRA